MKDYSWQRWRFSPSMLFRQEVQLQSHGLACMLCKSDVLVRLLDQWDGVEEQMNGPSMEAAMHHVPFYS